MSLAVQAGPSEFIRRHPFSTVIGTAAATFSLTAIAKLFMGGSSKKSDAPDSGSARKSARNSRGSSVSGTVLRSILHMGLPIIQSQLTTHFAKKHAEQQPQYAGAPDARESAHAVD